jgi:hypothetical protein
MNSGPRELAPAPTLTQACMYSSKNQRVTRSCIGVLTLGSFNLVVLLLVTDSVISPAHNTFRDHH